jgi:DNA-binding transcriptional ArsR family regulator
MMPAMDEGLGIPHPLPDGLIELIAERFRILAEPMRIRLLDQLRDGEASVSVLQEILGASQQNVSKHLATLYQAGLVSREKRGTTVVYAVGDPMVFELCGLVCGSLRRQLSELNGVLQGP